MSEQDKNIRTALRHAQDLVEADGAPEFGRVWAAAEIRVREQRKRRYAGFAATAAATVLVVGLLSPTDPSSPDFRYLDIDELLGSTSWSAPSDTLLPTHQIDLYQDVPILIESTEHYEGSLL
jgi:hypothetical protein